MNFEFQDDGPNVVTKVTQAGIELRLVSNSGWYKTQAGIELRLVSNSGWYRTPSDLKLVGGATKRKQAF